DDSAQCDSENAGFTDRTRNQTYNHIPHGSGSTVHINQFACTRSGCSSLSQHRSTGKTVHYLSAANAENAVSAYPNGITGHLGRIGEEQESTGNQSRVEDIHTCTTEYFLSEDNGERSSNSQNPQRTFHRNDHRDQQTGYQEAFLNFFILPLCHHKFDSQTYYV